MNHKGEIVTDEFDGLWARAILHEIDHFDGKLIIDVGQEIKSDQIH